MASILPLLGMAAFFMILIYFMMIRPLHQREKRHDLMVSELEPGDTVVTAGGMFGTIDSIDEDSVVLTVESGAKIRVTKGGVLKREE